MTEQPTIPGEHDVEPDLDIEQDNPDLELPDDDEEIELESVDDVALPDLADADPILEDKEN